MFGLTERGGFSEQVLPLLLYDIYNRASPAANSGSSSSSSRARDTRVGVAVLSAWVGLTLEPLLHVRVFVVCFQVISAIKLEDEKSTTLQCPTDLLQAGETTTAFDYVQHLQQLFYSLSVPSSVAGWA